MRSSVVVLDACVLFPQALRDTLLRIAEADLYEVHWTEEILEEVRRNLVNKGRMAEDKALSLITAMNTAFEDAVVTGYAHLIPSMTNHLKDRHVAAAAVACNARIIVTSNLKDFPKEALAPFQIEAQHSDTFLTTLLSTNLRQVRQILQNQATAYRQPSMTPFELLNMLAEEVPMFSRTIRQSLDLPPT